MTATAVRTGAGSRFLVSEFNPHAPSAESYRMLRTSVTMAMRDQKAKTFLVTSAGRGEGKSLTSSNLALTLADLDHRVLLLDCDLRLPSIASCFGIPRGDIALPELVDAYGVFDHGRFDCGVVSVNERLDVYPAGIVSVDHPSEFIGSRAMQSIVEAVRHEYDAVIIDSPPAGYVTDATVLSQLADAVLFVLAYDQTRRRFVRRSLRELERADANLLGVVLNQFPTRKRQRNAMAYLGGEYYAPPV